jgi:hypothetical protein
VSEHGVSVWGFSFGEVCSAKKITVERHTHTKRHTHTQRERERERERGELSQSVGHLEHSRAHAGVGCDEAIVDEEVEAQAEVLLW